jgi:hypothetical protein
VAGMRLNRLSIEISFDNIAISKTNRI